LLISLEGSQIFHVRLLIFGLFVDITAKVADIPGKIADIPGKIADIPALC
jgi:hypothetical protein